VRLAYPEILPIAANEQERSAGILTLIVAQRSSTASQIIAAQL
jgi:hypothetical protein